MFLRVTLPVIRPGLFAGALFAFTMSFDDFTVTIFLIGTDTHTLPVAIYQYMEWNVDSTVAAVSALLVAMSVAMMLLVERLIGLDPLHRGSRLMSGRATLRADRPLTVREETR